MELLETVADQTGLCLARYETQMAEGALLAAVSGGVDSTALLLVLARLLRQGRLQGAVNIAHVDHGTRRDSASAVHRVQDLADRFELPFTYRRLQLGRGRPSEAAMREARYKALEEMAVETGSRILLTAHHADDNIETVLFRMMRGTGVRGLSGIPESRWLSRSLLLVRPFLKTRRTTLEDLLAQVQVEAVEDPTNRDQRYSRNHLRHVIIPALREAVGPGLDTSMLAVTRTARAATDMLEAQGLRLLVTRGRWITPWRMEIDLEGHAEMPPAFLEEALRQAHRSLNPVDVAPLRTWCTRAMELLDKPAGRRLQGRAGLLLERLRGGLLLVDEARAGAPPVEPLPFTPDHGRFRFGATEWWMEGITHPNPPLSPTPEAAGRLRTLLNPHGLPTPWRMRRRRAGDRFRPLGAEQSIDLRHFLQRRHLPRFDRDRVPLLTDARDRILWIPGVEVAAEARLHLNTRQCVEVRAGQG
jgi:tRNA(Ile)-lysidine synthase